MLGVVYLLALAAAAHARPDAAPGPAPAPNVNTATNAVSAEVQPAEAQPARAQAAHRRFPHAVLFGGTCGGTVIDARWVLTAGHCTLFTTGHSVLAGTSESDDGSGVRVKVKKLYIHPQFAVGPYWLNSRKFNISQVAARWDFLLAELDSPLPLDGVNISAVPLDTEPEVPESLPVGYAGYGADHHGGLMRHEMHVMELRRLSDERCSSLEQYNKVDMVCAEGRTERRDSACNGDSGSGLVSEDDNRRLIGVASWVEDDAHVCAPGKIVVFSRVAAARPWIRKITGLDV